MDAVVFVIFLKALSSHFNAASLSLTSLAAEPSATLFSNAQVTWELITLPIPHLGDVGLTATYWGNVGVVVENLNKWLPANNSALKVRYLVSDGLLNYGLSFAGIRVGGSTQVKPGERIEITNIKLGPLSGQLIVLFYVSAETVAQGATPQTFSGELPTSATFVPSSNVQLNMTFYMKPIIRLQANTTLGSVNLDFPLEPKKGAQLSLKINRVILHSNCGTWINLTTGDPPYKPPRALTSNETTVCVLSRVLKENQTAAGYEIYAEYINPAATPSWQSSSIVVVPTGPGWSASQIGVWQIALWVVVGAAAFLAAYLLTGFIFNRRGGKT